MIYMKKRKVHNFLIMYLKVFFSLVTFSVSRKDLYIPYAPVNLTNINYSCQLMMLTAVF